MSNQIGRITLGATLLIAGTLLLISNVTQLNLSWLLTLASPLILIGLGLEWIASSRRLGEGEQVKIDGAAVAILVVMAMIGSITGNSHRAVYSPAYAPTVAFPTLPSKIIVPPLFGETVQRDLTVTNDLNAAGIKTIEVSQTSESVVVEAGPVLRAELRVTGYGRTSEQALEMAEQVELVITSGPVMIIRAVTPNQIADRVQVAVHMTVPEGIDVRVKTTSGSLAVKNIASTIVAEASSGSISVESAGGEVQATSSSGSIQILGVQGGVRANSSSGAIAVTRSEGPVSLQASSGRISVDAAVVSGPIDLTAASGSISVTLPTEANVNVRARSSSGTVSGPPWLVIGEGRNSGTGSLGAGEQLVRVNTGSGSITIGMR